MLRHRICPVFFLGFFLCSVSQAQSLPESPLFPPSGVHREAAPSPLPHVQPVFEDVRFWIGRQPEPDKILLKMEEIEKVNRTDRLNDPEAVDIFFSRRQDRFRLFKNDSVRRSAEVWKRDVLRSHEPDPISRLLRAALFAHESPGHARCPETASRSHHPRDESPCSPLRRPCHGQAL